MEETKTITENQLIIFKLGEEEFGVGIQDVREIITVPEITKIPSAEDYILGIIKLRGKIIVALDLEKKLKLLPSIDTKDKRIIIVELEGESVGMLVDSCNQVIRIKSDKIEDAPKSITNKIGVNYLNGVAIIDGRLIILLKMNKVFEGRIIENIKQMADEK